MVVARVEPDSPAAKVEIKENDILLSVGDKPIKSPGNLIEAVAKSEGKELSLKLIRGGKPLTLSVTPEKTSEGDARRHVELRHEAEQEVDVAEIERRIREKLREAGVDLRMQLMQPGKFVADGARLDLQMNSEFPDDLSVTVRSRARNRPTSK